MGGVRNRKKSSAAASTTTTAKLEKEEKKASSATTSPPYTTGTSDLFLFLGLCVLMAIGIQLVTQSGAITTTTTALQSQSSEYNCDEINVRENIVNNGQVHQMLQQIAQWNPQYEPKLLADNVIQLDHLLTAQESEQIIAVGKKYRFQESRIVDRQSTSGTLVKGKRTSKTLWCTPDRCENEGVMKVLVQRLQALLGISPVHYEPIQLLEYGLDQFYGNHSDFATREISRRPGPRVFTLLFYLTQVPEGGETYFNELNVTVTPQVGRAILWSNCENDNVHRRDPMAAHEALPVKTGMKYAGNVWIHLRNYREPMAQGCLQYYEDRLSS